MPQVNSILNHFNPITLFKTSFSLSLISLLFVFCFFIAVPDGIDQTIDHKELFLESLFELIGIIVLFAIMISLSSIMLDIKRNTRNTKLSLFVCFLLTYFISIYAITFFPLNGTFVYINDSSEQLFYNSRSVIVFIIQFLITSSVFALCFYKSDDKDSTYNFFINLICCFSLLCLAYLTLDATALFGRYSYPDILKIERVTTRSMYAFVSAATLLTVSLYYLRRYVFDRMILKKLFSTELRAYAFSSVVTYFVVMFFVFIYYLMHTDERVFKDWSMVFLLVFCAIPYTYFWLLRQSFLFRFILSLPVFLPILIFTILAVNR